MQSSAAAAREKAEVEAAKGAVEGQAGRLTLEADRLRRRAQELENEVAKLNRIIDEAKLQESRLGDRVGRVEVSQSLNCQLVPVLLHCWLLSVSHMQQCAHWSIEGEKAVGGVFGRN